MAQHEIKFAKVPLKELLEALTLIYETGYDFVDILGVQNGEGSYKDVIKISVEQEYYSDKPDDDDEDPSRIKISLN